MTDRGRIGVSTWSLRHHLGTTYPHDLSTTAIGQVDNTFGEGSQSLLDLPSALANRGYHRLDLVSFHLPSRDPLYLGELRAQLSGQDVTLGTLLIEAGDISHPTEGARDTAWTASWIDIANELGAESARIIAGRQQPTREALDRAVVALDELAAAKAGSPVRLVISNGPDLLSRSEDVLYILDRLEGRIGLLAEFRTRNISDNFRNIEMILQRAEFCHVEAKFAGGAVAREEFTESLDRIEAAGYAGPCTLIVENAPQDEWSALEIARDLIVSRSS